jgi:hypothetical protein
MSARAASSALILSLLIAPGFLRTAQAGPWLPGPGEYYTELRGSVFTAKTYHDDNGDRMDLGGTWEERALQGTVELGWKKRLTVLISAPIVSATRLDDAGSLTSTGLEDLRVGARFGLLRGATAVALEADWQMPLGYNLKSSLLADPTHGGGYQQGAVSLLVGAPLAKRGFLQVGAGGAYSLATGDQEDHGGLDPADLWDQSFVASADLGIWLTRSLLACGRYAGTMSMSRGDFTPERNVHLAGPALIWRVDDRLDLTAGSWSTAMAKNALHYDRVYVALTLKQTKLNRLQGFLGGTKAP